MERASKEALMTRHLKTDEVEVDGVGTVLVRGMSRWEMTVLQKLENDKQKQDTAALAFCMVEPAMNEDEIMAWRKAGGFMEIEQVAQKINELSGIGKAAAKSDVPSDGDRPVA